MLTLDELQHLPDVISAPRFATYLRARGNSPEEALNLYRWNLEVSAAFMGPLHLCEIAIRNGVAESLETVHGVAWPWTQGFVRSLPNPPGGYSPKRDLQSMAARHPTAGKVVSDLKFAFWERLLTQRYDQSIWQSQFFDSFPSAPQNQGFASARQTYNVDIRNIRLFRNRIAHHEPVFTRNLQQDLDRILKVIQWRNATASAWMSKIEIASDLIGQQP